MSEAKSPLAITDPVTDTDAILLEILENQRQILAIFNALMSAASQHPMIRAMLIANGVNL